MTAPTPGPQDQPAPDRLAERYRAVIDSLAEGVVIQDAAGRIVDSNPAARAMLGLEVDELAGRTSIDPAWHAVWPDGTPTVGHDHPATVARTTGQRVTGVVMGVRHASGAERWMLVNAAPLRDAVTGSIDGAAISFSDVTEARHREETLRDNEAMLRRTETLAGIGGWSYDLASGKVTWTDEVFRIHGLTRDYDPNSPDTDMAFYAPEDRARIDDAFRRAVELGEAYDLELRLDTAMGTQIWVRTTGEPELVDGRVVRLHGHIADITARRAAAEDLRAANARLRRFVDSAVFGFTVTRADGTVVEANDYYLDVVGYSREEHERGEVDWRTLTPDAWLPADERGIAEVLERGVCAPYEKEYLRRDGSRVSVLLAYAALPDSQDLAVFVLDVSERTRAERDLKRATEELATLNAGLEARVAQRTADLEAANHELEAFSYSVSHDLRAPLRAIAGFSQILTDEHAGQLDAEGQRLLETVNRNTRRMGVLIDDLLAFSRVARQSLECQPVDMEGLVASVVDDLRMAWPDHAITFDIGRLGTASCDERLLRQVWANLLGNALKFTRSVDTPRVLIRVEHVDGEDRFTVADNGVGFDPAYAGKLFQPFQRLHPASDYEGTGIGLAIVARVVDRHGGRVWADGTPGAGATFGFALPEELKAR